MIGGLHNGSEITVQPDWHSDGNPAAINKMGGKSPIGMHVINAAEKIHQKLEAGRHDSLTRVKNRKYYEEYQSTKFDKEKDDKKIAIIVIDLDDFKEINDDENGGHAAGDRVLREAATFFSLVFRKSDEVIQLNEVVRIGGDEFLIICHNNNDNSKFEEELNEKMRLLQETKDLPAKFSFGIAVYDKDRDNDLEKLRNRADLAMYKNKERKNVGFEGFKRKLKMIKKAFMGKNR